VILLFGFGSWDVAEDAQNSVAARGSSRRPRARSGDGGGIVLIHDNGTSNTEIDGSTIKPLQRT